MYVICREQGLAYSKHSIIVIAIISIHVLKDIKMCLWVWGVWLRSRGLPDIL